jgi:predicted P-loop ATPase
MLIMQADDKFKYDGPIDIAIGLNAASRTWKNTKMNWSELVKKLSTPVVTAETHSQFMCASKAEQSKIKDVGGFVGGYLTNGRREKSSVLYRTVLALDIDFSHDNFWWDFTLLFDNAAVLHATHKSTQTKPRHRLIMPLDREVSPEEYQAISRKVADCMNIDLFDQSTFEANRLMFWPSVSCDTDYYFEMQDGPFLCADTVLSWYNNWQDTTEWPTASNSQEVINAAISKQEDPTTKKGIIGIFCRTYTIQDAIEAFLSDIYEEVGDGRYTFKNGTTAAGLVTYEDKFAYSHHGTDPASGRLCNAFDLVRIHKFGHLDTGKETEEKERKSFKAMEAFATNDEKTKVTAALERTASAQHDFGCAEELDADPNDIEWTKSLEMNNKGECVSNANNINAILANDPVLKGAFGYNEFDNKRYVRHTLPWRKVTGLEPVRDVDYCGIRNYLECFYGIVSSQKIDDAITLIFENQRFNPVKDYIKAQEWDNVSRVDTLLIDYFGAEDNKYTRAAIRKMLCGAVARIFEPGIKFDYALILVGKQGTYKSTFIRKLGVKWFSDTFMTVSGKESFEQLQGYWLIEIAELAGLRKAEVETIKHYITKQYDNFRPAYGRSVEQFNRQCVFFGTTNNKDFLRDPTGNRRFMPIDVRPEFVTKSVIEDLTDEEVAQIWAEAYQLYLAGEKLYLNKEEELIAEDEQHKHSETDERLGIIEDYINKLVPEEWDKMDMYDRRQWANDPLAKKGTVRRDAICTAEIWCECLGKERTDMTCYATREINQMMLSLKDWEFVSSTRKFSIYGKQRYFKRK